MKSKRLFTALLMSAAIGLGYAGQAVADKSNDTIVAAFQAQLPSLDRYHAPGREGFLLGLLAYDALLYRDPNTLEIKPLLATEWKQVDELTYEFKLRPNVKFHNGDVMSAKDVVYSLKYSSNPANRVFNQMTGGWIADVVEVDPLTVRIKAKSVTPIAYEYIVQLPIVPMEYRERVGKEAFGRSPVGTGPYKVAEVNEDSIVFERNEDYFEGGGKNKPHIAKLIYRAIPDVNTQVAELISGGIDWAYYIPSDAAERLTRMNTLNVVNAETFRIAFLTLDASGVVDPNTPLKNPLVRKAIAHAIDREAIAKGLVGAASKPVNAACTPRQFGCTDDVAKYEYDPKKAKELMKEAGFENGFNIDIYGYRSRPVAEAIIGYLNAIGIRANLRWQQYSAVVQQRRDKQTPIVIDDFGSAGVNDVAGILPMFFIDKPDDYARDAKVNDAINRGGGTTDPEARKAAYHEALGLIADNVYWVPLFTMPVNYVSSTALDVPIPGDENVEFWKAQWK